MYMVYNFQAVTFFQQYIFILKGINDYYFPMPKQNKTPTVSTRIEVDIYFCYFEQN